MDQKPENKDFTLYEFRVQGELDDCWAAWFNGMNIHNEYKPETGPVTVLKGNILDQVALHGILAKIRDLNLKLISVRKLDSKS
jgi:hypothetical protein